MVAPVSASLPQPEAGQSSAANSQPQSALQTALTGLQEALAKLREATDKLAAMVESLRSGSTATVDAATAAAGGGQASSPAVNAYVAGGMIQPVVNQPAALQPAMVQPIAVQPIVVQPIAPQIAVAQPVAVQPTAAPVVQPVATPVVQPQPQPAPAVQPQPTPAPVAPPQPAPAVTPNAVADVDRGVLMIGDSLGVGTMWHLQDALPGVDVSDDVKNSRRLSVGMDIYNASQKPGVVMMGLFTNNGPNEIESLRSSIQQTIDDARARDGRVVWATIVRPPVGGVSYDAVNAMIRDMQAQNRDVMHVVDWAQIVAANPSYLAGDGVHATSAGYKARAEAFAAAARE